MEKTDEEFKPGEFDYSHHKISVAPMMEVTDTHFRYFMRLITKHATLWTEMYHANTVIHNVMGPKELLKFNNVEHPLVLQLGGNDPEDLAKCAKIGMELGYDEINQNCGCPSPKVTKGSFGACLMIEAELVGEIILRMNIAVDFKIPIHVKCRLGVDSNDDYEFVRNFVDIVSNKGKCNIFIIHARKALLKGLNPTQNRNIPPQIYERVYKLKEDFPHITFLINGGFKDWKLVEESLQEKYKLGGVMIGRGAQDNPMMFSEVDKRFYNKPNQGRTRRQLLEMYSDYGKSTIEHMLKTFPDRKPVNIATLNKPLINIFAGNKNSSKFKRYLSDSGNHKYVKCYKEYINEAIKIMEDNNLEALDEKFEINDDPFIIEDGE